MECEIGPQRRPEKPCAADCHTASMQHVNAESPSCLLQIREGLLDVPAIELMVAGDIEDRCDRKLPARPLDAASAGMDVAREDDDIGFCVGWIPVLKFEMQIGEHTDFHGEVSRQGIGFLTVGYIHQSVCQHRVATYPTAHETCELTCSRCVSSRIR